MRVTKSVEQQLEKFFGKETHIPEGSEISSDGKQVTLKIEDKTYIVGKDFGTPEQAQRLTKALSELASIYVEDKICAFPNDTGFSFVGWRNISHYITNISPKYSDLKVDTSYGLARGLAAAIANDAPLTDKVSTAFTHLWNYYADEWNGHSHSHSLDRTIGCATSRTPKG